MILVEVTRKLRRVMTRSSRPLTGLIYLRGLNEVVRTVIGQKLTARYSVPENSRTPCLRLSISWTISKSKDARRCLFVGHVALQRLQFTSRQSVRNLCPQSSFMSQINSRGQGMVHDSQLHATGYSVWSCAASCRAD